MPVHDAQADAELNEQTLTELGLTEQPFSPDNNRQPFADSETQRARGALEQNVRFGDSLHLLIGENDAGKTILLKQLLKHCKNSIKPFVVKGSADFRAEAFLYAVMYDMSKDVQADNISDYVDKLSPMFEQIADDQRSALMIVDDAHLAPIEEIAELVDILQHFENENGRTARLLLTGTPELSLSISRFEAQFEDLDLKYSTNRIEPLDDGRTREYLSARLHQAGFADAFPFTDKAVSKIQRESNGLPGKIDGAATHYLNGVYRGDAANEAKGGFLSSFEWPVLLVGAAAICAIGLGLSMFFGNDPDTNVVPVATTTEVEQPVVETASVNGAATAGATDNTTIQPAPIDFSASTETDLVVDNVATPIATPIEDTEAVAVVEPSTNQSSGDLVAEARNNTVDTSSIVNNEGATVPAPGVVTTEDPAASKSIGAISGAVADASESAINTGNNGSNDLLETTESQNSSLEAAIGNIDNGLNNSNQGNTGLLDGDTDATGRVTNQAPVNEPVLQPLKPLESETEPATGAASDAASVEITQPQRAIENERWVLFQAPTKFTVQLATSRERGYIIDLAQTMVVAEPVAIYPFLTSNSNNPVFGLLSGLYDTRAEAIAAVEAMDAETTKFGVWIRPVGDLQDDIKRRQ